jgi:hypothetical protein
MVEKFKKILGQIVHEKGKVKLFAIMKMDDITDKWSVILSADWSTEETNKEDFKYVLHLLMKEFSQEELATIARVVILSEKEHLVESLLKFKSGSVIKDEVKINGNLIHEATIFASAA